MPNHMTRRHLQAHLALLDWSSWLLNHQTSHDLGYQMADWLSVHGNTPPQALIPRIAFTPTVVRQVTDYYRDFATPILRRHMIEHYLKPRHEAMKLTTRQKNYLLDCVGEYLTRL